MFSEENSFLYCKSHSKETNGCTIMTMICHRAIKALNPVTRVIFLRILHVTLLTTNRKGGKTT